MKELERIEFIREASMRLLAGYDSNARNVCTHERLANESVKRAITLADAVQKVEDQRVNYLRWKDDGDYSRSLMKNTVMQLIKTADLNAFSEEKKTEWILVEIFGEYKNQIREEAIEFIKDCFWSEAE